MKRADFAEPPFSQRCPTVLLALFSGLLLCFHRLSERIAHSGASPCKCGYRGQDSSLFLISASINVHCMPWVFPRDNRLAILSHISLSNVSFIVALFLALRVGVHVSTT